MAAERYADRSEGGARLAEAIRQTGLERPLVLGVPRGGVPVAARVATELSGELDVIVVRKIGAPQNPELGLGAVGATGEPHLDERLLTTLSVDESYLRAEIERQRQEAARRLEAYRGGRPSPEVEGRDVVVVDDGIATGGTVIAAAQLLRKRSPGKLVLGVPVAPKEGIERVSPHYDEVVCPLTPEPYFAVGQWYADFHQVSDEEVRELLEATADA